MNDRETEKKIRRFEFWFIVLLMTVFFANMFWHFKGR